MTIMDYRTTFIYLPLPDANQDMKKNNSRVGEPDIFASTRGVLYIDQSGGSASWSQFRLNLLKPNRNYWQSKYANRSNCWLNRAYPPNPWDNCPTGVRRTPNRTGDSPFSSQNTLCCRLTSPVRMDWSGNPETNTFLYTDITLGLYFCRP